MPQRALAAAALTAIAALLAGSGTCTYRGHDFGGGASSTQTTVGPVGGFGSVFVSGTEFATGSASFSVDGTAALESQLLVGQVPSVAGSVASGAVTGTASLVAVTTKLVGPVTAVDLAGGTLTVLGQTVRVGGDASVGAGIAPSDPGGVLIGDLVAVDGYRTTTGLVAARLDRAPLGQPFRVTGRVASLSGLAQTFLLAGTTIDFSAATGGLPSGVANGSYVVATGTTLLGAAALKATRVSTQTETAAGSSGTSGNLHGAITRFASASDFDVAGQPVSTSATTTYAEGSSADLALDAELEVSGTYDASGRLTASSVRAPAAAIVRVVGAIDALDASAKTLRVAGITLTTDARTRWDDRLAAPLRTFSFADLRSGDWVEARGVAGGGAQTATVRVLERRIPPATPSVELQDVPAAVADPQFTLTGIAVNTSGATFADATGASLTRAAFFGQVAGRVVRARGTLAGGTLSAATVALRD